MEIYVNGSFQAFDTPTLTVSDPGFLYGEAVYESIRIVDRRPLFLRAHLDRLAGSAESLEIPGSWNEVRVRAILGRLLDAAGLNDAVARLARTRGPGGDRPTELAWVAPLPPHAERGTPPWRVVCHPERVVPYLPHVKHTNHLVHTRARRRAKQAGADEALLVHLSGDLLEGSASNVFFFLGDTLKTPSLACGILSGITRETVLKLAGELGFTVAEGHYNLTDLGTADECFLSFTSAGVRPVASLNGAPFPSPVPGRRTVTLGEAYEEHARDALAATEPV